MFWKKKKEEEQADCGWSAEIANSTQVQKSDANQQGSSSGSVKILGSGCNKCRELEAQTKAALEKLGMDDAVEHITDLGQIAAYGVMSTPSLIVDGKVLVHGRVVKADEIAALIQKAKERV